MSRMTATALRDASKLQRLLGRGVIMAVLTGLLFAIFYKFEDLSYQGYMQSNRLETSIALTEARGRIERQVMDLYLDINELASEIGQNPDMERSVFDRKAGELIGAHPELRAVALVPGQGAAKSYPRHSSMAAPGVSSPAQHGQQAPSPEDLRPGEGLITGPAPMADGVQGLTLHRPVFTYARQGTRSYWGSLSVTLEYNQFITQLGIPHIAQQYALVIRSGAPLGGSSPEILWGQPELLDKDPITQEFTLPFGAWQMIATPKGGWPTHRPDHLLYWTQSALLIIVILSAVWYVGTLLEHRRKAERLMSTGIEALDHGFVMFDKDRRLVAFNKKYKQLAGGSGMVKIGSRYEDIVVANLRAGLIPDAIGREKEWYDEWSKRLDDKAADKEQVLADGRLIRAYDRPMEDGSVVGLRIDITDLKKAQIAAEAANQAKTDFMGVLSHELRTPLTVILGHAQLAKSIDKMPVYKNLVEAASKHPDAAPEVLPHCEALAEQITKMMLALERSGNHLFTLISEILDFAKIDSGTLKMEMTPATGPEIAQPIIDQMRPMVEDKGLTLTLDAAPCAVEVDTKRIQQILINLIGNASKFTDTGGITVAVRPEGEEVVMQVTDTGIGIPQDQLNRVFEAFHQVDSSSGRKYGGTGLGLAISADIARAHGGNLSATSVLEQGSTFTLRLPRAEAALPAPEEDTKQAA